MSKTSGWEGCAKPSLDFFGIEQEKLEKLMLFLCVKFCFGGVWKW